MGLLAAMLGGADPETSARAGHSLARQVVLHRGALIGMRDLRVHLPEAAQRT